MKLMVNFANQQYLSGKPFLWLKEKRVFCVRAAALFLLLRIIKSEFNKTPELPSTAGREQVPL